MDYQKLIIDIVRDIDDERLLKMVYDLTKAFVKHWGYS